MLRHRFAYKVISAGKASRTRCTGRFRIVSLVKPPDRLVGAIRWRHRQSCEGRVQKPEMRSADANFATAGICSGPSSRTRLSARHVTGLSTPRTTAGLGPRVPDAGDDRIGLRRRGSPRQLRPTSTCWLGPTGRTGRRQYGISTSVAATRPSSKPIGLGRRHWVSPGIEMMGSRRVSVHGDRRRSNIDAGSPAEPTEIPRATTVLVALLVHPPQKPLSDAAVRRGGLAAVWRWPQGMGTRTSVPRGPAQRWIGTVRCQPVDPGDRRISPDRAIQI